MTYLYLVRHAEVTVDADALAAAWQLSPAGVQAARELAHAPHWRTITVIASSPEPKAIATAKPIAAAAGLSLCIEPGLREVERGTGLVTPAAYQALVASHFAAVDLAGWEPARDAASRISACIDRVALAAVGSACIVSHGLVLVHYLAQLQGTPPDLAAWQAMASPAVAIVDPRARRVLVPFTSR